MNEKPLNYNPTAFDRLKDTWNENPLLVIGVATGATMALAKLIDAVSATQGRRAYARLAKRNPRRDGRTKVDYAK